MSVCRIPRVTLVSLASPRLYTSVAVGDKSNSLFYHHRHNIRHRSTHLTRSTGPTSSPMPTLPSLPVIFASGDVGKFPINHIFRRNYLIARFHRIFRSAREFDR